MGWFFGRGRTAVESARAAERSAAWQSAFDRRTLPPFVAERLGDAATGRTPWTSQMSAAELRLVRSHGIRPIAIVSGTCWYHFGWSWTEGHETGWHLALDRLKQEALAAGANAVVDVKLRTIRQRVGQSMDFTLIGTAVKLDRLPASTSPAVATVSALEWVRLLEAGIVPTGLAVGAAYEWITDYGNWLGGLAFVSAPLDQLGQFWNGVRREAHADLRMRAAGQGNGVLAHTHFGQLIRRERDKQPTQYLGRHIVLGTVVDVESGARAIPQVTPMLDMLGPGRGLGGRSRRQDIDYGDSNEGEGPI